MLSASVVVCTRDRPELLAGTVPALTAAQQAGAEIVIVDSASIGPATRSVAEKAGFRVVRCDRPGLSVARNAGLEASSGDVIVFTDDDCLPEPGWVDALVAAFADERIAFATGRVFPGPGSGRDIFHLLDEQPTRFRVEDDVDGMGHGANMAFRRTALEAIDGFDEWLGAGSRLPAGEDKDAFWRLLRAGWDGAYVPAAVVAHAAWRTTREALAIGYGYGRGIGGRMVKVARLEGRSPLRAVLAAAWASWREGMSVLRAGGRFAALSLVLRGAGVLAGGAYARRYRLEAGRFRLG